MATIVILIILEILSFSLNLIMVFKLIRGREIHFSTGKHGKIRECKGSVNTAGLVAHSLNISKSSGFTWPTPGNIALRMFLYHFPDGLAILLCTPGRNRPFHSSLSGLLCTNNKIDDIHLVALF